MPSESGQAKSRRACGHRARRGRLELIAAGEIVGGERGAALGQARACAVVHDLAAALAAFRAKIDDVVRSTDDAGFVLDDNQCVSEIAKIFQQPNQPLGVARVQADAGFVEDVQHVHQFRPETGSEVHALGFAAGQRARRPVEREVAKADAHHGVEPAAHLGQHRRKCV